MVVFREAEAIHTGSIYPYKTSCVGGVQTYFVRVGLKLRKHKSEQKISLILDVNNLYYYSTIDYLLLFI